MRSHRRVGREPLSKGAGPAPSAARRPSESVLAAERDKLRAMIGAIGAGLCTLDPEGRVRSINPEGRRLLGCSETDLLGACFFTCVEASWDSGDVLDCDEVRLAALSASGQPLHVYDAVFIRKDGRALPVSYTLSPMLEDGVLRGAMLVFFDLTERKQFETELIRAREKAEELSRLKSAFLNNMSHEIRTPLTAIIGFSAILSEDAAPEHKELVELIEQSGKRLLKTLNAVLDLSMLEAGSLRLENERFDLVEAVEETMAGMMPVARTKGIDLRYVASAPRLPVNLDRTCLDRVLTHLIDNALKFTHQGGVTVRVGRQDGSVRIRVEDTGIGICASFLPHLFNDFKQESTGLDRSHNGIGLGLAVTRRLVRLMGGDVTVESEKGRGSRFEVSFVQQGALNGRADTTPAREALTPRPSILMVEDTHEIEMLVEYMLRDTYEVVTTQHEEGALALARQRPFDLVLMDINLGSARTGVDVMKALREVPGFADVPIVAMTAYALLEDRTRFLEAGFDGYLSKPFSGAQARDVIEPLIAQRRPA